MIKRKYLFVFIIISILTNWILTKHGDAEVGKQNSKSIFIKKGDGTIVDSISGLMWQEKDSGITMNLSEAEEYSSNLRLAEYADWRLPTKNELLELTTVRLFER